MNKRLEVEDNITMVQEKLKNVVSLMGVVANGLDKLGVDMEKASQALFGIADLTKYISSELGDVLEKVGELER